MSCYKNGAVIGKWNSARTHSETQPRAPRVLVRFADSWKCFLGVQNVAVCRFSLAWVLCWSARAGGGSRSRLPCCVCVWFACAEFHVVCVFVRSAHFSTTEVAYRIALLLFPLHHHFTSCASALAKRSRLIQILFCPHKRAR